jgi:hypothetical protein
MFVYFVVKLGKTHPPTPALQEKIRNKVVTQLLFHYLPRSLKSRDEILLWGKDITPMVLRELKLWHDIICAGIALCMVHLECIH